MVTGKKTLTDFDNNTTYIPCCIWEFWFITQIVVLE